MKRDRPPARRCRAMDRAVSARPERRTGANQSPLSGNRDDLERRLRVPEHRGRSRSRSRAPSTLVRIAWTLRVGGCTIKSTSRRDHKIGPHLAPRACTPRVVGVGGRALVPKTCAPPSKVHPSVLQPPPPGFDQQDSRGRSHDRLPPGPAGPRAAYRPKRSIPVIRVCEFIERSCQMNQGYEIVSLIY